MCIKLSILFQNQECPKKKRKKKRKKPGKGNKYQRI